MDVARNKKLLRTEVTEEIQRVASEGLTGRMAGPRAPRPLGAKEHKRVAGAGVRYMNASDPDDNTVPYHPSKRELAMHHGKRKRKMSRR